MFWKILMFAAYVLFLTCLFVKLAIKFGALDPKNGQSEEKQTKGNITNMLKKIIYVGCGLIVVAAIIKAFPAVGVALTALLVSLIGAAVIYGIVKLVKWMSRKFEEKTVSAPEQLEAEKKQQEHDDLIERILKEDEREKTEFNNTLEAEKKQQEHDDLIERILKEDERKKTEFNNTLEALPSCEIVVAETPAAKRSVDEVYDLTFSSISKKSNKERLGNFVVIDTETTGLYPSKSEIVEISAIRFRYWKPVEKFSTLCSAKKGISEDAARINGITAEMVEGKPLFGQVAASLQDFIGKDNLIGHNLEFDLKFIVKYGVDLAAEKRKYFDTLDIAQRTIKKQKQKWDKELCSYFPAEGDYGIENHKLDTLCRWYGIAHPDAHRALADCYATALVFEKLVDEKVEAT